MFGDIMFRQYFLGFKNYCETGDVLSKEERLLVDFWNYLGANTKFKNITLNCDFESVTFESKNRKFMLELTDDEEYNLTYIHHCENKYDKSAGVLTGDFYTLRNWFKKRNYLK